MTRTKSALIIFIFVAVAVIVAVSVDYTDTYVADRFHHALETGHFAEDETVSLDRFLEYYDWDTVCVVTPAGTPPELKTQLGRPYTLQASGKDMWSLVFIKSGFVEVEIPIARSLIEPPLELSEPCMERWAAIVQFNDEGDVRTMEFVGQ